MQLVLLIPIEGANLPGFGGGIPAFGGRPDQGLPIFHPGHPDHGLPSHPVDPGFGGGRPAGGRDHISNRPPNVPPNVVWPPSNPNRPDNSLPSWQPSGNRPSQPIAPPTAGTKPVEPEAGLPAGSSLVLVYNAESGWQGAVVDQSGTTKPIAPPTAQPK